MSVRDRTRNPSAPDTPEYDEDGVQRFSQLNSAGQELPDPVPTVIPTPLGGETLGEQIAREIRLAEWRRAAATEGLDTPEEADDFDIEDDPLDPLTPWEAEYEASQESRRKASQKASEGSASAPVPGKTEQTQKSEDVVGKRDSVEPGPGSPGSSGRVQSSDSRSEGRSK